MNGPKKRRGVISQGIKTPIIQAGDDLEEIVISSVAEQAIGGIEDGDVICVTEAVVAISQGNFVTPQNISEDIARKFPGVKEIVLVDPIQSRNRFMHILKAIAQTPQFEKIYIVMSYPADEVGNRFASDMAIRQSGVNPYTDILTVQEFYQRFGEPKHCFTGKNYIHEYMEACEGKAEILLGNDFSRIPEITGCEDYLICSIHRSNETRYDLERGGAKRILDLSQIMDEPIGDSGYNSVYGLYGSNAMSGGRLKLMPRECNLFAMNVRLACYHRYGKEVEVMVYGDGAFKDPVGGIWELADPTSTLGATRGLKGTPKEVKLKYIASKYEGKNPQEIEAIVASEKEKRLETDDLAGEASLGTTPRRITDLLASLADLTSGSGDRQTPVILIKNYL